MSGGGLAVTATVAAPARDGHGRDCHSDRRLRPGMDTAVTATVIGVTPARGMDTAVTATMIGGSGPGWTRP